MFGIGLPEMIVILAVALIVVGPDKLPELARSLARGVQELKKTVNQVKESLDEDNLLADVENELKETAGTLQEKLLDDETHTWKADDSGPDEDDVIDLQPLEERPWERERKKEPDILPSELNRASNQPSAAETEPADDSPSRPDTAA